MGNQTIGVAGVDVFTDNPDRASLTLRNESTAGQIIGFSLGVKAAGLTVTNRDYVLRVAEEKTFIYDFDGMEMRGNVVAIADAAGAILVKAETSFKKR